MNLTSAMALAAAFAFSATAQSNVDIKAGKTTYENSCNKCHGLAGSGSPMMDQFYKTKIPRLNDNYVQGKSDQELENIMLNGKRKMPAVMLGADCPQNQIGAGTDS